MIKAIIFDLDGTLLNTLGDIHCVLNDSLTKFGLPEISIEQTKQFVGNGARKLVEKAVGEAPAELVEKVYKYYSEKFALCGNENTKMYDGEEEALYALRSCGIKFAIVTNKPQGATERVYRDFLAKFEFSEVLGQTEYYPLKPNPASTLAIIDKMMINKEDCLFVGDGETDVLTAKAAGIKCVSALWGYRTKRQLEAAGATIFADNYKHFLTILNGKNY